MEGGGVEGCLGLVLSVYERSHAQQMDRDRRHWILGIVYCSEE